QSGRFPSSVDGTTEPLPAGGDRKRRVPAILRGHFLILYARSPAEFFEDSILASPCLPRMLTNPRTVCFCQPVAAIISASVAPRGRRIMAMTSAFLLLRSPAGWLVAFWAAFADAFLAFFRAFVALGRGAALGDFFGLLCGWFGCVAATGVSVWNVKLDIGSLLLFPPSGRSSHSSLPAQKHA